MGPLDGSYDGPSTLTRFEFGFDGLSPGVELRYRVDSRFWSDPDAFQRSLQAELDRWLRERVASRTLAKELAAELGDAPMVEVILEDGSVRVKAYLSAAWLALALAGCAAAPPQQPQVQSFRQETITVLEHVKSATHESVREFDGELTEERRTLGHIADIDAAFEEFTNGGIQPAELIERLSGVIEPMNNRADMATLQVTTLLYVQERYGHVLSRLPKSEEVTQSREVVIVSRIEVVVEPKPGTGPEDLENEGKKVVEEGKIPKGEVVVEGDGALLVAILTGLVTIVIKYGEFFEGLKLFLQHLRLLRDKAKSSFGRHGTVRRVKTEPYPFKIP